MGFWKSLGSFLESVLQRSQNFVEEANQYYEKYCFLDRDTLITKYKTTHSMAEKAGIAKVMKEKGWAHNS